MGPCLGEKVPENSCEHRWTEHRTVEQLSHPTAPYMLQKEAWHLMHASERCRQPGHVGSWNEWLILLGGLSHDFMRAWEKGCNISHGRCDLPGSSIHLWMPALTYGLFATFVQTVLWVRYAITLELDENSRSRWSWANIFLNKTSTE